MSSALPHRWSVNPIWQKSVRSRMRPRHMLSWGIVTITVTVFLALIIYMTMTEQEMTTSRDAAKAVLPAVVVVQAIILMMFGTGAVAAGVSQERDEGLLDYQRMTPMRPTAKILGYLFGLPVREYALFALTLPVVAIAAAYSGFSVLTLVHFYAVFFTSVLVYHMTGLVAGMVTPKARLASMGSIGLVAVLYFVLPNLSRAGITFFEFLTIRPTFFGLLQQELPPHMRAAAEASGIDSFRDVPLFTGVIHPTLYTLLVQGFLLAAMFSVAHRRWRNPAHHLFSKVGALAVFSGVLFFVVGSVWAVLVQEEAYRRVFAHLADVARFGHRSPHTLQLLLSLLVVLMGAAWLALVTAITPSRHTTLEGWRRARKLGRTRLPMNSDAASSLPVALVMLCLTLGAGALLLWRVGTMGEYYLEGPTPAAAVALVTAVGGSALFAQGVRESLGLRVFAVSLFVLWMAPLFAMMIMYSAFEAWVAGAYVGLPCPPVLHVFSIGHLLETTVPFADEPLQFLPPEFEGKGGEIVRAGAWGYALAGLAAQAARWRTRRALRAGAQRGA